MVINMILHPTLMKNPADLVAEEKIPEAA